MSSIESNDGELILLLFFLVNNSVTMNDIQCILQYQLTELIDDIVSLNLMFYQIEYNIF